MVDQKMLPRLSECEWLILCGLKDGCSLGNIANRLNRTPESVRRNALMLRKKFNADNRDELVATVLQQYGIHYLSPENNKQSCL